MTILNKIQEWALRDFNASVEPYLYDGAPFAELHFTLYIRRRTLYYFSNLILPCVIIGRASILEINRKRNRNAWAVPETAKMFLQKASELGTADLPTALSVDL